MLAERCSGEVVVVAGQPDAGEAIGQFSDLEKATFIKTTNVYQGTGPLYRYSQPGIRAVLDQCSPSIFFSEANPRFSDLGKIIKHAKSKHIPAIGWGVGTTDFWNKPLKRLRVWYRDRAISKFDALVCYSSKAAKQYQGIGFAEDQTVVLYNATLPKPKDDHLPKRAPISGPVKLLSIGRLIKSKSVDRLVEAAAIVQQNGHEILVRIVGDGPAKDSLQDLAARLNSPVEFLGRRTGDDLAEISRTSDLFVLPGLGGLAIQEAMTHGLPVIVTEADGTELDLVRSNGWIAEKDDTTALVRCIEEAISDPGQLRRCGEESFRIVRDEINLDLMADRFINAAILFSQRL
jgi:glycosyltransferase involved in cell wall biosynthesis